MRMEPEFLDLALVSHLVCINRATSIRWKRLENLFIGSFLSFDFVITFVQILIIK